MELYADIIVNITARSLDRVFQYRVPQRMEGAVVPGSRVLVPFGRGSRLIDGIVVRTGHESSIDPSRIKEIHSLRTDAPSVQEQLVSLAAWMSRRYGTSMAQCLKTVMPVKKKVKEVRSVRYLITDREKVQAYYDSVRGNRAKKAQARLLKAMLESEKGSIPAETAAGVLQVSRATIRTLAAKGLVAEDSHTVYRSPGGRIQGRWDSSVRLSAEQQSAVDEILASRARMDKDLAATGRCSSKDRVHLLHGITGSGKTEVYMALMDAVLREGKQVIVLIPEISLTLQTVSRFYERFGDRIAILNSKLSAGERYDQYMRAKRGDASIMIGPRSALFTPFEDLGMIIIDEEHESSYKSETAPRYLARDVAVERARMAGACVVLGSATPSLSSYYNARRGIYSLHVLRHRAKKDSALPQVQVVDLREEFRERNMSILSRPLHKAMENCLENGEQMMLFLNRRGYAGFVSCRSCGYVFKCEHCDVSMTIHGSNTLVCHYCGSRKKLPEVCPECGSPHIAGFGLGTQKLEYVVKKEFPQARVLRMDRDTTSGKNSMEHILRAFSDGEADILIGTQMIVKGHDFDRVTLVGVVAADLSMFSGDYLSSEKTFQLLTQAAGRAGRGSLPGHVIIQTYRPEDACIVTAAAQDYEAFYEQEMQYRSSMGYPPAAHMLLAGFEGPDERLASEAAYGVRKVFEDRQKRGPRFSILGPAPARIRRIRDRYRYVLYVKCPDEDRLISLMGEAQRWLREAGSRYRDVTAGFDIDPFTLF